jgi:diacylglycerol kinase (ATP)
VKAAKNEEQGAERAAKLARAAAKTAKQAAALRQEEEQRAAEVRHLLAAATVRGDGDPAAGGSPEQLIEKVRPRRRALLIVNSKSGPDHDSLLRVRELVALLATHGVDPEVRVKLRKKQARRDARRAARAGYPLVIAAGGDGTVEAVASGLVGTASTLGVIPLGTYNNVAHSLGIPDDPAAACALIAAGTPHPIDVGVVRAAGKRKKKQRVFLEMAAVGLTAALMPAGQEAKKGDWDAAGQALPQALQLAPVPARISLDGAKPARRATTLLVEIANAPRMGPALEAAPEARMDDGLLDVAIYHEIEQAALMVRFVALRAGGVPDDDRIERARAGRVSIKTDSPLPVVADSKVVGTTPAKVEVLPGGLLVIAGHGPGLSHPAARALVAAVEAEARAITPREEDDPDVAPITPPPPEGAAAAVAATVVPAVVPAVGKLATAAGKARALALPAIAGAAGAAALPLLRLLSHRRRG